MVTYEQLEKKWNDIEERWEETEESGKNPYDEWNEYLDSLGRVSGVYYECHWGKERGIFNLVDWLIGLVNGDERVYIVEDPADGAFLAFKRES
jgi:hypothetical protein